MSVTTVKFKMDAACADLKPRKAHADDAAYDLYASADGIIPASGRAVIPTGVYLELPVGFEAQIRPRSGLAAKSGITVLNTPGTIDAGYRGEVGVIMYNGGTEEFPVRRGDRIAQMVIARLADVELDLCDSLNESDRGSGGFGSTGKA